MHCDYDVDTMEDLAQGRAWSLATIHQQQKLVSALVGGDDEAIDFFFSRQGCSLLLWRLAKQWASRTEGGLNQAEDLYSEAVLKLAENRFAVLRLWQGRPQCQLPYWISRVVLNHFRDIERHRRLERTIFTAYPEVLPPPPADQYPLTDIVRDALEDLRPTEREVLQLVVEGYSNDEIARTLNLSVQAATVRRHRALNALRECIRRDYPYLFSRGEKETAARTQAT